MEKKLLDRLTEKINDGSATDEELSLFNAYMNSLARGNTDWTERHIGGGESVKNELWKGIERDLHQPTLLHGYVWKYIVMAAAVAAITLGVWVYYSSSSRVWRARPDSSGDLYANHITPGKNTAALTLASGEVINLDTSKTSVVAADSVKTMVMLTASTPRGGTYMVVLPDGTKAWLNADSKITFPSQFRGSNREVSMVGEIYFEVAHNKTKPFIVKSQGQRIEVLGTHFNVNAYADEGSVKTTLLEGSVRIASATSNRKPITLLPNQQAILAANDKLTVSEVNAEDAIAWKNGLFIFDDESLEVIMQRVSRWYKVEIEYDRGVNKNRTYGGSVSRYDDLSSLLEVLESTKNIHFKVEGRRILVMQ